MNFNVDTIKNIYEHLGDDCSRRIFTDRLMFSLTSGSAFLQDCVAACETGKEFIHYLKELKSTGKEIIVYGAGVFGGSFYATYGELINFYVDKSPAKKTMGSLPVYRPDVLKEHKDGYVLLAFGPGEGQGKEGERKCQEVRAYLSTISFPEDHIVDLYLYDKLFLPKQYFDLPALRWESGDTFVDAGCYDGYTSIRYLENYGMMKHQEKANIIAFDADAAFTERIEKNIAGYRDKVNFELKQFACWDTEGEVRFCKTETDLFEVADDGDIFTRCTTIDAALQGRKADFIKMDIEGAEYRALVGAEHTIRTFKPQLAISIYHRPEDMWRLPEIILKFNPEYKLFLRHYTIKLNETVLYAIPQQFCKDSGKPHDDLKC